MNVKQIKNFSREQLTRDDKVRVHRRGPADLALAALSPYADLLPLVGQVLPAGKVEGLQGCISTVIENLLAMWVLVATFETLFVQESVRIAPLHGLAGGPEEVLCAPGGRQVVEGAVVLRHPDLPGARHHRRPHDRRRAQLHRQVRTVAVTHVHVHCEGEKMCHTWTNFFQKVHCSNSLCSPEFVPHITGGLDVPVLVTMNLSVRH